MIKKIMVKQSSIFLCIILILYLTSLCYAKGKAISMGNLETIVPSGPFDTARNPALLAFQNMGNSTGLFSYYIAHFPGDTSSSIYLRVEDKTIPMSLNFNTEVEQKDPTIKGMSGQIANSTKAGNIVFGFAFTEGDNNQFEISGREIVIRSIATDGTNNVGFNTSETSKTTEFNPEFALSTAFDISRSSSIGFQMLIKYFGEIEKKDTYRDSFFNSILEESKYQMSEYKISGISAEIGFGYLYMKGDLQIGLLIRSGDMSWIKKSLKVDTKTSIPALNDLTANSNISLKGLYTSAPGLIAGGYKRINPFIALAVESGFQLDNTYIDRDLKFNDDLNIIEEQTFNNTIKKIIIFKGGIELNPLNDLAFMCGTGYSSENFFSKRLERRDNYEDWSSTEIHRQFFFSTFGIEYVISKNIRMNLSTAIIAYEMDIFSIGKEEDDQKYILSNSEMNIGGYFLQTGLGITLSF